MNGNNLRTLSAACVCAAVLFSLTTLSFHADISVAAFPLALAFTAVTAVFGVRRVFAAGRTAGIPALRELLQYLPYVLLIAFVLRRAGATETNAVLDAVSVLLWVAASALTLVVLYCLNPKRVEAYIDGYKVPPKQKRRGLRWLVAELVGWIDALVQAVFMVLLLNIFIVQLYEIPSESMVPEFLIKDRVVVFKTLSGPTFPLSNIRLPYLKSYRRGDIVVFRNPHYANDRTSELKTFVGQLVYMISLTKVNINRDANGNPKADPLVKRVAGVPGEQLVMQDGILYHRTKENGTFAAVTDDATWAAWNLNETKSAVKKGIQQFPLTDSDYEMMRECEQQRRDLDLAAAALECKVLAERFRTMSALFPGLEKTGAAAITPNDLLVFTVVQTPLGGYYDYWLLTDRVSLAMTYRLLQADDGADWFARFMTAWTDSRPDFAGDPYAEASYRLNVMVKLTFGRILVRNVEQLAAGVQPSAWGSDAKRFDYVTQARMLCGYLLLHDRRNMPVFPPNDADGNAQYIPAHHYFMMGDNRFNSLDMRHSYDEWVAPLTPYDEYSVTYYTNMQPQYVPRGRILGTTAFRFWPLNRAGVPGHTGK